MLDFFGFYSISLHLILRNIRFILTFWWFFVCISSPRSIEWCLWRRLYSLLVLWWHNEIIKHLEYSIRIFEFVHTWIVKWIYINIWIFKIILIRSFIGIIIWRGQTYLHWRSLWRCYHVKMILLEWQILNLCLFLLRRQRLGTQRLQKQLLHIVLLIL